MSKRIVCALLTLILVIGLIPVNAIPAFAKDKGHSGVVTNTDEVNVRKAAGVRNDLVTQLKRGTKVTVYETVEKDNAVWGRIDQGWIYMFYVALDAKDEGPVEGDKPASNEKAISTGYVNSHVNLNVRTGPGVKYTKTNSLPYGTKVSVYEKETVYGAEWGRIDEDSWVALMYVDLDAGVNEGSGSSNPTGKPIAKAKVVRCNPGVNIRSGAGTQHTLLGKAPVNSTVTIYEETTYRGTKWVRIDKGWVCADYLDYLDFKPDTNPGGGAKPEGGKSAPGVIINTDLVNVRKDPGVPGELVMKMKGGTKVTVYETRMVDNATWGRIDEGWVYMFYVKIVDNSDSGSGTIEGSGNTDAKTNAAGTVVSSINLNVRKGPGVEYDAVGSLKPGSKVTIYEQTLKGGMSWGRIANGWISLNYVTMDSTGNTGKGQMGTIARCFNAVNVRSAPGTGSALVGTIAVNSRVEILQQVNYNGAMWGRVANGWVSMQYVLLDSELPNPPKPEGNTPNDKPATPTTPVDSDSVAFSIGCNVDISSGLKIRKTATSATDNVVGELKNGQFVQVKALKQVGSKLWGQVEGGWIDLTFVKFNSNAIVRQNALPVRKAPSAYSDKVSSLAKDKEIIISDIALDGKTIWAQVKNENGWIDMAGAEIGGKPGEPVNDNPAVAVNAYGVTHHGAVARKDAVAAAASVFTFPGSSKITFMALKADVTNKDLYWARIEVDGKPCWISLADVDISMPAVVNTDMTKANQKPGKDNVTARVYNRNEKVTVTGLAIADGEIWAKVGSYWVKFVNLNVDGTPDKHVNKNPAVDFYATLGADKILSLRVDASDKCDYITGLPAGPFDVIALKNDDEIEGKLWAKTLVGGVPGWVDISSNVTIALKAMVTAPATTAYEKADADSQAVEVLAQNKQLNIDKLKVVGTTVWGAMGPGWVNMLDVTIGAETPKPINPNHEYTQTLVATVSSAGADTYMEAHLNSDKAAPLPANTAVNVAAVKADVDNPAKLWGKVSIKGVPSWVQMSKLSFNMDVIVKDEFVDIFSEAEGKTKASKAWHNDSFKITEVALAGGKVMGKQTAGWLDLASVNLGTTKMPWENPNPEIPFKATFSIMLNTTTYETATRLGLPVGSANAGGTYTSEVVKVGDGDVFVRVVDGLGNRSWFNLSQAGISMAATAKKDATLLADSAYKAEKVADLTENQALSINGIRIISGKIWICATVGTVTGWQLLDMVNY